MARGKRRNVVMSDDIDVLDPPPPENSIEPAGGAAPNSAPQGTTPHDTPTADGAPNRLDDLSDANHLGISSADVGPEAVPMTADTGFLSQTPRRVGNNELAADPHLTCGEAINELVVIAEQHSETLKEILSAIERLESKVDTGTLSGETNAPNAQGPRTYVPTNPPVTEELSAMVKDVVKMAPARAKQTTQLLGEEKAGKKPSTKANRQALQAHLRQTLFDMCEIKNSLQVRPAFRTKHGQANVFPIEPIDYQSDYKRPYPSWDCLLDVQVEWLPTLLHRFFGTVPNDNSLESTYLRQVNDRTVIEHLHDAIFVQCRKSWLTKIENLDADAIANLRSEERQDARQKRLANVRGSHRGDEDLTDLRGPDQDYLFDAQCMSREVSDDEGVIVKKVRPPWRASWVTNYYVATDNAERKKSGAPKPPAPIIERAEDTGLPILTYQNKKKLKKIPYAALKGSWARKNEGRIDNMPGLNPNLKRVPCIDAFLAKHYKEVLITVDEETTGGGSNNSSKHPKERLARSPVLQAPPPNKQLKPADPPSQHSRADRAESLATGTATLSPGHQSVAARGDSEVIDSPPKKKRKGSSTAPHSSTKRGSQRK